MPEPLAPASLPDSRPLHRLIRHTRQLLRSSWIITGLGLTIGLLLGALAAVALVDLLVPVAPLPLRVGQRILPGGGILRLLGLGLVIIPATWAFLAGVVRPLFRRLSATHVARRIENHLPGIHNRLVSCVDLDESGPRAGASPAFHRRLLSEALERIRGFRPSRVLDLFSLRRAAVFGTTSVLVFVLAWYLFAGRMPTALARIFHPFDDIPPASDVAYTVNPGDTAVLREEPIAFTVEVTSAANPESLRLELYGDPGSITHRHELKVQGDNPKLWHFQVADSGSLGSGYKDGFRYRVFGGGTWSKEYHVTLVERPELEKRLGINLHLPAYMGIEEPRILSTVAANSSRGEILSKVPGPEGSQVEVIAAARGQVASGAVQLVRPSRTPIPHEQQVPVSWYEDELPAGVTAEGSWTWVTQGKRRAHTEPGSPGTYSHWYWNDPKAPTTSAGRSVTAEDVLFAEVFVLPGHLPKTIMLKWYDGSGWEHRAFWGEDHVREGRLGTESRLRVGDLPAAGQWVRLEVPAAAVGLDNKSVEGVMFTLHDGRCYWGRVGTLKAYQSSVAVVQSYPMTRNEAGHWTGRFPLQGKGLFRVELRNAHGHANKEMEPIAYDAESDRPPVVRLDLPREERKVLNKPEAFLLNIEATDDYGLSEINLLFRRSTAEPYRRRTLKSFPRPQDFASLKKERLQEAAALPVGGQLLYVIEARDRKVGPDGQKQFARTREYTVTIDPRDNNASDRLLANHDQTQDEFQKRLIKLIGQQKKVQEGLKKLKKEYEPVTQKVEAARAAAEAQAVKSDPKKPPQGEPPLKLDPETAKRLEQLRKEIAKLSQQEAQNTQTAQQLNTELAKAVAEASKLELPQEIAREMQATQQTFQRMVTDAMRNLGQQMSRDADGKQNRGPNLDDLNQQGDRLQKELEGIKSRLDALSQARKNLRDLRNLENALARLKNAMRNEDAKLSERELQELREYMARLREALERLRERQDQLRRDAENGADLKDVKDRQAKLDREMQKLMADARNLLGEKRNPRRPRFPDTDPSQDGEEKKMPPREEDTDEPLPMKKDPNGKTKAADPKGEKSAKEKKDEDDDEEKLFMPRLGGPKPKIDPRYAKKRRPVQRKPKDGANDKNDNDRANLEDRQTDNQRDLQSAEQSLKSDQQSVESLMQKLEQAMKGQKGQKGQPDSAQDSSQQQSLSEMLKSQALQQAMAMAARMRQGRQPGQQQPGQPQPGQQQANNPNMNGLTAPAPAPEVDLSKLDPESRRLILKLPPSRMRDELIQGMNEKGPEAYREFIRDYFKRLAETREPAKK